MSFRNGRLITGKNTFGSPMEVEGPMLLDRVELVAPPAGSPEPEDPRVEIPDGNREGQTATAAVVDGIADLSSHLEQPHPVAVVHEYVEGNGSPEAVAVLIDDTTMDRDAIVAETPVDRNHEAVVKETRKWLVVGRKRKWIRFLLLSVILSAVVAIGIGVYYALTPADQTVSTPEGPLSTLESIQARGFLNCGIPEDDGQLLMDGGSVFSNFSIDLVRLSVFFYTAVCTQYDKWQGTHLTLLLL